MSGRKGADLGLNLSALGATSYKGAWSATATYVPGDIVTRSYSLYVALSAASAGNDPATAPTVGGTQYCNTGGTAVNPGAGNAGTYYYSQFTTSASVSVGAISMTFAAPPGAQTMTLGIVSASPGATPTYLAVTTAIVGPADTTVVAFFSTPVTLASGTTYYVEVQGTALRPVLVDTPGTIVRTNVSFVGGAVYSGGSWGASMSFILGAGVKTWDRIADASAKPTVLAKTATYVMSADDVTVLANGTFTVTLPTVASAEVGRRYTVKNTGTGTITIAPASGTIDGAASAVMTVQYSSFDFMTDGTNWYTV